MSRTTDARDLVSIESPVREWVERKLGSVAHELRVAKVATMLFDLTQQWHELTVTELRLLTSASLVHDVGRCEGAKGHAKTGARMILEDSTLPLGKAERRRLAFLTRYHRGSVPDAGSEQLLDRQSDDAHSLRAVLGLLRAADALDSRSLGGAHLVATKHGRILTIFGYLAGGNTSAAEKLGRPKKFKLLESTLRCQVRTTWHLTDRLAMVS